MTQYSFVVVAGRPCRRTTAFPSFVFSVQRHRASGMAHAGPYIRHSPGKSLTGPGRLQSPGVFCVRSSLLKPFFRMRVHRPMRRSECALLLTWDLTHYICRCFVYRHGGQTSRTSKQARAITQVAYCATEFSWNKDH